MRHGRQDEPQPVAARLQDRDRLAERLDQPAHLALARAGQQEQRLFAIGRQVARRGLGRRGRKHAGIAGQPMADKGAGRTAEALQFGGSNGRMHRMWST